MKSVFMLQYIYNYIYNVCNRAQIKANSITSWVD